MANAFEILGFDHNAAEHITNRQIAHALLRLSNAEGLGVVQADSESVRIEYPDKFRRWQEINAAAAILRDERQRRTLAFEIKNGFHRTASQDQTRGPQSQSYTGAGSTSASGQRRPNSSDGWFHDTHAGFRASARSTTGRSEGTYTTYEGLISRINSSSLKKYSICRMLVDFLGIQPSAATQCIRDLSGNVLVQRDCLALRQTLLKLEPDAYAKKMVPVLIAMINTDASKALLAAQLVEILKLRPAFTKQCIEGISEKALADFDCRELKSILKQYGRPAATYGASGTRRAPGGTN